tara:strand:+ start:11369 stop:12907 length:1539 start_codon:yes stop_codon:yes gene_type:complete
MMRRPLLVSIVAALLSLGVNDAAAGFESFVIETGSGLSQTLLTANDRLYVFTVDADGQRSYRVGEREGGYVPAPKSIPVAENAIFVDKLTTPSGSVVVLLYPGEVKRLDTDQSLLSFESIYNVPVVDALPRYDAFRDVNDDGLDDFLIPSFRGYHLAVQRKDGTFAPAVSLTAVPVMEISYNNHPWYQAKSLFRADMNLDGRKDLVLWDQDHFAVYPQLPSGEFSPTPFMIASTVAVDFDSVDGMSVSLSNQDQSDKIVLVVHGIDDYDGDGVPDLMTMQVKSEGVFRKTTTFSLHPGVATDKGHVVFATEPTSTIESNGIQYEMQARDLDGDMDLDLVVSSVELGVGKIIAALLTGSIKIELGFYTMDLGLYSPKPVATREITATFSLSTGEFWLPAVIIRDIDGDGRDDLLLQDGDSQVNIFAGEPKRQLFSSNAQNIELPMPREPDLIEVTEINDDGISDLLIRIPPPLGLTDGQHRVAMLLSKRLLSKEPLAKRPLSTEVISEKLPPL